MNFCFKANSFAVQISPKLLDELGRGGFPFRSLHRNFIHIRAASGVNSNRAIFCIFHLSDPPKGLWICESSRRWKRIRMLTRTQALHSNARSQFPEAAAGEVLLCKCENETHKGCLLLSRSLAHSVCIQFHRRELHSGGAVASQFNHFIIPRERFCWHKVPPNYHKRASPLCDHGGRRRRDNSNNTSALAIIRLFIAFFRPCCNKNATAHLTFSSLALAELKSERIIIYALVCVCAPHSV